MESSGVVITIGDVFFRWNSRGKVWGEIEVLFSNSRKRRCTYRQWMIAEGASIIFIACGSTFFSNSDELF